MRGLSRFQRNLSEFLTWWVAELVAMLPPGIRARLSFARERIVLRVSDDVIGLELVMAEGAQSLDTFALGANDLARLGESVAALRGKGRQLVLQLAGRAVLVREASLPSAVQENLAQVLRYEMDRYTPFKADAVYYGYRLQGGVTPGGKINARLAVVPRAYLDHWLQELSACGVRPDRVEAASLPGVSLVPDNEAVRSGRGLPSSRTLFGGAVVFLMLVALLLPLWVLRSVVVDLNQEVARVQEVASRAQVLREERDRLRDQEDHLLARRQSRHSVVSVLNEVARVLPDDSWVHSMQINDRRLVIQGFSGSASGLIERIESSPMFSSAAFTAPVTRDSRLNQDVFQIALEIMEVTRER